MTTFFTAASALRRVVKHAYSSSSFTNAALVTATASIAITSTDGSHSDFSFSSSIWNNYTTTSCLAEETSKSDNHSVKAKKTAPPGVNVRTRMTSIGRFSLESQTKENPSVPAFFMALSGTTPLTVSEFTSLWNQRNMAERHPRFHSKVSETHPGHFEATEVVSPEQDPVNQHVRETMFPSLVYRKELMHRIEQCLIQPIHVWQQLWDVQISSGPLGQSGAISKHKTNEILQRHDEQDTSTHISSPSFSNSSQQPVESLLLFRSHHAMADGVSLIAALSDLCDEAEELRQQVVQELERRRGGKSKKSFLVRWLKQLIKALQIAIWLCVGSIQAVGHQMILSLSSSNPFEKIRAIQQQISKDTSGTEEEVFGRTLSWCDAARVEEIKEITNAIGGKVTLNDVMVSCVSYAVAKQIEYHRTKLMEQQQQDVNGNNIGSTHAGQPKNTLPLQKSINVAIPVHLGGGVVLPGKSIGNNIGAFVAKIPGERQQHGTAMDRLQEVHKSLYYCKRSPAPLISHYVAKFCSTWLPTSITQRLFENANGSACVAVSNSRASPTKLHLGGRAIESTAGFFPLPPGISIGVIVQTYAGTCSLSVTAEKDAVPDADQFLQWMLEEYQELCQHAQEIKQADTK